MSPLLPIPAPGIRNRGMPRVQYRRTYVLLPSDAGREWAIAVVNATWDEEHYTVGSSADDAGVGDLDERSVVAINPTSWPDNLESFFKEHYPGVKYSDVHAVTAAELGGRLVA
jgi:hypothetical protein